MRIYLARPKWMAGTPADRYAAEALRERFPGAEVVMPDGRECRKGAEKDMRKYFRMVDRADVVVAVPADPQGKFLSAGAAAEVLHAIHDGKEAYLLVPGKKVSLRRIGDLSFSFRGRKEQSGKWARVKSPSGR